MQKLAFLQPDIEQIRHQLRGVIDSYSHDWDVLAELAQNSIDSIARAEPTRGHIEVSIDSTKKTITFLDNGTGIDPGNLEKLLRPFGTDKLGLSNQIGQKGVGLTFVIFSSSQFQINTHHENGSASATVSGAATWLKSESNEDLMVNVDGIEPKPHGTEIIVSLDGENHPLWTLNFEQINYLLRSRTALGNTDFIWSDPLNCDTKLQHIDNSGNVRATEFDCNYMLPIEGLKSQDTIELSEFIDWRSEADRSDQDKRRKLQNKIVWTEGKKYQAGRDLKFWSCFVPNRSVWETISKAKGLLTEDPDDADIIYDDEMFTGYHFNSGLYTSSRGMPTGIYVDLKPRGSAGYVPNFFIIIEDPSLSFDIGRKSIQGRQQTMLREIAYGQFRTFLNSVVKYISGAIDDPNPRYDREKLFKEINDLPDLEAKNSNFLKRPNGQEATVAGMFFERMGAGDFGAFRPLISGYKGRYDLYGVIEDRNFVIEFKYTLDGLFRDFSDERKMFDEIDAVVVWDITERDRKLISNRGLTLTEIESGIINKSSSYLPNAQYKLNIDGVNSLEIVCMKKILKPEE